MPEHDHDTIAEHGFILHKHVSCEEFFVDGTTHVLLGVPNSKVLFHSVLDPAQNGKPEIRVAQARVTIPTLALVEFAKTVLFAAKQSEHLFSTGMAEMPSKMSMMLADVSVPTGGRALQVTRFDDQRPPALTGKK